jgi:hypothetical protein
MLNDLYIQFPEDFDECYEKYVANLKHEKPKLVDIPPQQLVQKYYPVKEGIALKTLGIEIKGNYVSKGKNGFEINPTDRDLIDFLNYRFLEDKQYCISPDALARQLKKDEGYIKNRIVYINKEIKKLINPTGGKTNIDEFIKNETNRGYHLNARFVIDFIKK